MAEKFSEADIKRFQDGKKQKRTVVTLDDTKAVEFARMLQRKAAQGEFELKFNMSSAEVERQRQALGLIDDDTVNDFLAAMDEQSADLGKTQDIREEEIERQKRLDALNAGKPAATKKKKSKSPSTRRVSADEQQKALDKLEADKRQAKPTTQYDSIEHYQKVTGKRFRISPAEKKAGLNREEAFIQRFKEPTFTVSKDDEEQFKLDARLGMRMLCNKYGAKRSEIAAELERLDVNTDMLRR